MDYNDWLISNTNLIPYISLTSVEKSSKSKKQVSIYYSQTIERLKNLVGLKPVQFQPSHQPKPLYLGGEAAMFYYKKMFLKDQIDAIILQNHNQLSASVAGIISLLANDLVKTPDNMRFHIEVDNLEKDFSIDNDTKYLRFKTKFAYYEQKIDEVNEIVKDSQRQKLFFEKNMNINLQSFDPNSSFLKQVSTQDQLELLFEYTEFPLHGNFIEVVQKYDKDHPHQFIRDLIQLVYVTLDYFQYRAANGDNVLILVFFRYAFAKLYSFKMSPLNRDPFDVSRLKHIDPLSKYLSDCTFEQLKPPDECCPPHTAEMKVSEVFRNSADYEPAIYALEQLIFHTNPIDALNAVHDCLNSIEIAVNKIHPTEDAMLPFEVTFGIFLCVASASHIPELQNYSDFIDECAPESGLSAMFDFAHTKLKAATSHLRHIVKLETSHQ